MQAYKYKSSQAQATEMVRALRYRSSSPGFQELKCEVQSMGGCFTIKEYSSGKLSAPPGKRHASSFMLILPHLCNFSVIFQVESRIFFLMCHIPVLLQVAPYCDIMNCVTGALRRRKGWSWTWLFIKTPEGSLKPQF